MDFTNENILLGVSFIKFMFNVARLSLTTTGTRHDKSKNRPCKFHDTNCWLVSYKDDAYKKNKYAHVKHGPLIVLKKLITESLIPSNQKLLIGFL